MKKLLFAVISVIMLSACGGPGDLYVPLASCMTEQGVKEYGTFWCPNCARQKKAFGDEAFEKITYIECDPRGENQQSSLCIEKGIEKYPTWEFSDGSRLVGTQELSVLAEKSGCEMPVEE